MKRIEILPGIDYIGVNDRTTHRFEALWPLPSGVSYNSYLVCGQSKSAIIDGVEISQCEHLLEKIGNRHPDYLVINHMEPDHSGSIPVIRKYFPDITIVGNVRTAAMIKSYYGIEDNVKIVEDGEVLDLGGLTMKFFMTPMVHWPETMMTFVPEQSTLFSGDAFGCFGALNGAIVDKDMDITPYIPEMYRYYACIVGKYGLFVQKAINKLSDISAEYICPTHGPVWNEHLKYVCGIYNKLSKYEAEPGVVVVYGSMYGNTEQMAELISSELAACGVKKIRMHNVSHSDMSYILSDIFRYNGLVIGAPTYSNTLFPPIESLMQAIKTRELKNRHVAAFGSFTWASQALKQIKNNFQLASLYEDGVPEAETKCGMSAAAAEQCVQLARYLAKKVLSEE